MITILHNLTAEECALRVGAYYRAWGDSVERMASGKKIRNAADDPAGLVSHARMATSVRALGQAQRNAQDAISMLQTGEGALQVVDQVLVRMKELAAQAASDSYSPDQRRVMDAEFRQLASEVDRIARSTTFNGIDLLSDGVTSLPILVGDQETGGTKTLTIDTVDATAGGLGIDLLTLQTADGARSAMGTLGTAMVTKDGYQTMFGYKIRHLENAASILMIQREELGSAASRIADADVAKEAARLMRNQVLAQAQSAIMHRANDMAYIAVALLNL